MSRPFRRQDFDAPAFYAALNKIRNLRDFTWKEVSAASGVSTTTLSRMADGRHPDAASLASLSHWAGMNPANFMADPDKPPYDKSLAAIAVRLRNSIAWLRDGTPTTGGGIGLGDMIDILPIVEAALATNPQSPASPQPEAAEPVAPEWAHLKRYGYAPGDYMNKCHTCGKVVEFVDKRAITCRPCAESMHAAPQPTPQAAEASEARTRAMNAALTYRNADPEALDEQDAWANLVDAIGALAASSAAQVAVPDMVLVPREPTEAMLLAARDWSTAKLGKAVGNDGASGCYRAMLAAAPVTQVSRGERE